MLRTLSALFVACCALLPLGTSVQAGGWATISFVDPPADLVVDEETTLTFEVLAHNDPATPMTGMETTFLFEHRDTGYFVAAEGVATDDPGLYEVTVALPQEGTWSVKVMILNYLPSGPILWNSTETWDAIVSPDMS